MKSKLAGLIIFAAWVFVALPAIALNETPLKEKPKKSKDPIEITSDRMRSENGGSKNSFFWKRSELQGRPENHL